MIFSTYRYISVVKKFFLIATIILFALFFVFLVKNSQDKEKYVIFVVDVSQSMNVQDVFHNNRYISRLDAAKLAISGLIQETKKPIMRGVIIYSSVAKYLVPPTQDTYTLLQYLINVNTHSLPGGGSNPESVFPLLTIHDKKVSQTIIRHTDGERKSEPESIKTGKKHSLPVPVAARVVGRGTSKGGAVKDASGIPITKQGKEIIAKRNDQGLEKLASYLGAKLVKKETTKKLHLSLDDQRGLSFSEMKWWFLITGILAIIGSL